MNTQPTVESCQVLGIDLGTTNTVMSAIDDTGKPQVLPTAEGDFKTPSVVHVAAGARDVLVGEPARNMQVIEPARTFQEFKRDVGTDKVYATEGGIPVTPGWLQARLLTKVKTDAVAHFGNPEAGRFVVVTVPAYFRQNERQSVESSAKLAGTDLLGLISEPTAAGLAFGVLGNKGDRTSAILDCGGGTFDVSIVRFEGAEANVLGSHGDKNLGGKDVDAILMNVLVEAFDREHGLKFDPESHPAEWFTARDEVIRQKHLLAARKEVKLCARCDGKQVVASLDRAGFDTLLGPLLVRVEDVITRALDGAKVAPEDVQHVLFIGGSTRLVAFQDRIKQRFGADKVLGGNVSPDFAVAQGAAIHAAKLIAASGKTMRGKNARRIPPPRIKHTDVMPHSLGVAVLDDDTSSPCCSVILERNQPLPCEATKSYAALSDDQTHFHIQVVQGEENQSLAECLVVGESELQLPARPKSGKSFEVTMGYNPSGIAKVTVFDLVSKRKEDITVNSKANGRNGESKP